MSRILLLLLLVLSVELLAQPVCLYKNCKLLDDIIQEIDYRAEQSKSVRLSCRECITAEVTSWIITRQTGEVSYLEDVTPTTSIQFEHGQDIVFSNVSVDAEGLYTCRRGALNTECRVGCIFVKAPGVFASCPDPRSDDKMCIDMPREEKLMSDFVFNTAAIFRLDMSGPCNYNQSTYKAKLSKLGSEGGPIFTCTYDRNIDPDSYTKIPCRDMGRVKVKFNTEDHDGSNAFNFGLELTNVQPSDSGLYVYEAIFLAVRSMRIITKHFNLTVVESMDSPVTTLTTLTSKSDSPVTTLTSKSEIQTSGLKAPPNKATVIAGIIVGALVVLAIVVVSISIFIFLWRQRHDGSSGTLDMVCDSKLGNGNDVRLVANKNVEADELELSQRPRLDQIDSYIELFPTELSDLHNSEFKTV